MGLDGGEDDDGWILVGSKGAPGAYVYPPFKLSANAPPFVPIHTSTHFPQSFDDDAVCSSENFIIGNIELIDTLDP